MVQAGHDNGAVHLHSIPDAVFELAKVGPSNVFDDRRVLVGILADAHHGFVDALQKLITEARLLRIVPFAGLLDVNGGQRREANRMRQRGDGGSGRRAFRSASTSSHGRAAFASSSKVSSRSRMMRSTSGVTGRSLSSASAGPGRVGGTGAGSLMGLGYARTTLSATGRRAVGPPARFSQLEPIGRVRHAQVRGTRHDMQLGRSSRPRFGEPIGGLTDANFGRIITGAGERRLQLGARLGF
jgi:hypothetical protein